MTVVETVTAPSVTRKPALHRTLWGGQIFLALFFGIASAGPKLPGEPTIGLIGLMIDATSTQPFVLDDPVLAITPAVLAVVFVLIAWGRRPHAVART